MRCRWLDEVKQEPDGPFVRSRLVSLQMVHGIRFDTFAGTAPLSCIKKRKVWHTRVLGLYDISVASWHALIPHNEPIATCSPRGEEEAGSMWQVKRAIHGASRLFQEHMRWVLGEPGHESLRVCHQVHYCFEVDSMAASHGDNIIAEGEPEELDRFDAVPKRLVVVKGLDSVDGSGISCTSRATAWSGWKIRSVVVRSSRTVPRLERSRKVRRAVKTLVAATLTEVRHGVPELVAKLYQQGTGISIYVSRGRFDMQL